MGGPTPLRAVASRAQSQKLTRVGLFERIGVVMAYVCGPGGGEEGTGNLPRWACSAQHQEQVTMRTTVGGSDKGKQTGS